LPNRQATDHEQFATIASAGKPGFTQRSQPLNNKFGIMNAFFTKLFFQESNPRSPGFQYGFLALILALFAAHTFIPTNHYFSGFLVPLMLLFNHLAFQFQWPRPVTIMLRACALFWVVFGGIVICYQSFAHQ